ncbi:MAG TPA: EAL domain-containing protein [Acidobacteriaceae bacterium]|jgi:PAS domain S-box-containing protein/diguanylate cyclase (GGDEF)-like protein|nr:EAL domain-containing protein [Acidobacteriaceae bacterium]
MPFLPRQISSARKGLIALLVAAPPLAYGVVAVIVATVSYSALHFVPLLRHDLELLQSVPGTDAASRQRLEEVSTTLRAVLKDVFALIWLKIFVLVLLVWTDWKRLQAKRQLKRVASDLAATQDRFRQAYESATVGMGIFKVDGTVVSVNAKGAEILGYEPCELIGRKVSDFMAPEHVEDHLHRLATTPKSTDNGYHADRRVLRKDGREAWVRNSVVLFKPEGQEPYYFSISEETTLQRQANDRLTFLANYDPVTNLPNRRFFEEELAAALGSSPENVSGVALLYLEIDSFDFLKGTFSRTVADEMLSDVGSALAAFRQPGEIIARLDDHVFGVLIVAAPYDDATILRAGELRKLFHGASETGRHQIPLSASIGVAYSAAEAGEDAEQSTRAGTATCSELSTGPGSKTDSLLKFARAAMLEARSRGGDSIHVADPALQERAVERHQIELALIRGLRRDEFRVVFQPQFEVATGRLVRFEALCRWDSAELGPIAPDRFIPIAEQTGLISEIGRRIMHEALRQAKNWTDSGRQIGIGVNISPMQFMRPDFTHSITELLANSKFPPSLLELEITEGIFIRDLNLAVARIRELQRLGLSIALDDFGTGYSSLSYLQRMPINAVKLDRSFVSELTTDTATVSMVRSVLAMAKALNLRVVTEGVETQQQLDILKALGCDEAQGYLLGRPESAEQAQQRVLKSPVYCRRHDCLKKH